MARYILIRRIQSNGDILEYQYGPDEGCLGLLQFDCLTGQSTRIRAAPGEAEADAFWYSAAAYKLLKHWKEGEMPERTCFAS